MANQWGIPKDLLKSLTGADQLQEQIQEWVKEIFEPINQTLKEIAASNADILKELKNLSSYLKEKRP